MADNKGDYDFDVGLHKNHGFDKDNPHPGFGKDPNIINELGHTEYPKLVNGVVVNNPKEERDLTDTSVEKEFKDQGTNWNKEAK